MLRDDSGYWHFVGRLLLMFEQSLTPCNVLKLSILMQLQSSGKLCLRRAGLGTCYVATVRLWVISDAGSRSQTTRQRNGHKVYQKREYGSTLTVLEGGE